MSKSFGNIFQIAWVVDDIEAHIDHWTRVLGVGPFFHFPVPLPFDWVRSLGEDTAPDAPVYEAVAVSYSGDTMIELIQPGTHPSTYREFLDSGRSGVHHLGTMTDRLDEQVAEAKRRGAKVVLEGELPFSRFAYIDSDIGAAGAAFPGAMIELIEARPAMIDTLAKIRDAARDWDGKTRLAAM
ncbi:VOC family protein [Croceicoccus sp. YJ47]|uniref:VOC family protein n=1 Tax=Croceicoccus sp. YJ47 TaxID=2798724 RepID=UPI001921FF44|nr:VOC family protein [Croceicoccus sp. YJ47]QQN75124.1 VOC family protein [Croceicoccus sp. YJ47]